MYPSKHNSTATSKKNYDPSIVLTVATQRWNTARIGSTRGDQRLNAHKTDDRIDETAKRASPKTIKI
jgi:hypothetical protein